MRVKELGKEDKKRGDNESTPLPPRRQDSMRSLRYNTQVISIVSTFVRGVKRLRIEIKKKASKPMFVKNLLAPCLLTHVNRYYSNLYFNCNYNLRFANRLSNKMFNLINIWRANWKAIHTTT